MRRYINAFVNRLSEALGEAIETQAWLDHALACGDSLWRCRSNAVPVSGFNVATHRSDAKQND
jgi:hypothetical protein